jgi:hypothetical protein
VSAISPMKNVGFFVLPPPLPPRATSSSKPVFVAKAT